MKPNIHQFPEAADPAALLSYKIAVMQAYADGKPLEARATSFCSRLRDVGDFNWSSYNYRIAAPKPVLASGRNNSRLTEEQVGVRDGWRLLTAAEHTGDHTCLDGTSFRRPDGSWSDLGRHVTGFEDLRTKFPVDWFLPKEAPKVSRFFCFSDGTLFGYTAEPDSKCYCLEAKPDGTVVYLHLDGHVEPAPAWTLERCLKLAAPGGSWKEFDGSMEGFRPKPVAATVASGHNPRGLTVDQIGAGFRTLTADEAKGPKQTGVQFWSVGDDRWRDSSMLTPEHCQLYTYRTSAKPGEYLPKPALAGHNPENLTAQQLEAEQGWRLLSSEEHEHLRSLNANAATRSQLPLHGSDLEHRNSWESFRGELSWLSSHGGRSAFSYRTRKPAGWYTAGAEEARRSQRHVDNLFAKMKRDDAFRALADLQSVAPFFAPLGSGREALRSTMRKLDLFDCQIAEGHNPLGLTNAEVGVTDGWRLLSADEIRHRASQPDIKPTRNIQNVFRTRRTEWSDAPARGNRLESVYRTKLPAGHFLPRPKPTTVKGWLETLPPGYRERALRNLNVENADKDAYSLSNAIFSAFVWCTSPEGPDFWVKVSDWAQNPKKKNQLPALPKQ